MLKILPPSAPYEEHYKKIISLGKQLKSLPEEKKTPDLLVKGCSAKVWLLAELNENGEMELSGDGDPEALISRGLLALMLAFYSGRRPEDVLKADPVFLKDINLSRYLSRSRSNGLNALIRQIKYYAKAFLLLSSARD